MKRVPILMLALALFARSAAAGSSSDAEQLVSDTVNAVLVILREPELAADDKRARVLKTIEPVFDLTLMAKLALGKRNWRLLNEDQSQEFTNLFVHQLRTSYLEKAHLYSDEKIEIEGAVAVEKKVHVTTYVLAKDDRFTIIYKLYESGDKWRIYDVEIEGVSIVSSYRRQYTELLSTRTVDDLLQEMRNAALDQPEASPQQAL